MTDLTTQYLGLYLKNPIIAASSGHTADIKKLLELEKNGVAAVVLKSIFEEEIINDFHESLNADDRFGSNMEFLDYYDYDLKEEAVDKYIDLIKEAKQRLSIPVIASVNCVSAHEWTEYAVKFQAAGADAIELNIFILPSDSKKTAREMEDEYFKIIEKIQKVITIPVAIKIGPYFSNLSEMIQKLDSTGIAGLVLFNRSYSPDFDIERMTVTSSNVLSRPNDYILPLRWIALSAGKVSCSLAASTGIHDGKAVIKMLLAGADVVQIASSLYLHGEERVTAMIADLEKWMSDKKYLNIDQFRGKLSHKDAKNPADFERVQFMKHFRGKEVK